jgi:uncharacterized protein YcbX
MKISQLWSYPVKSMVGEQVPHVELSTLGIMGDRHWAIRDLERGGIRGGKKIGALMQCAAQRHGDDVIITLPNGVTVSSQDANVNEVLSQALNHPVELTSLPADNNLDHFRRGPGDSDDPIQELRTIFGRTDDEPLPNFAAFPPEVVEFESPPGTHYDCWPLMVMTTSAMDALRSALPNSVIDERRFRPSLVVETTEKGHVEFSWKGKRAQIGTAVVEFLDPCPRCVMVTQAVNADIGPDRDILRHIVRDLDQNVGMYARVISPGSVSVGDTVQFL